jgi:hypothetical protein
MAVGGSLGKDRQEMLDMLSWLMPLLPRSKPNHLLGIADPESCASVVPLGIDDFVKGYEEGDYDKVVSIFADSIRWYGPGVNAEMLEGIDVIKENVSFWMGNFENISFTEGGGLPGTDIGFWGGNTYPVSDAMSGPNNVRMYGTWDITNSSTGKEATFKHYVVLNFNEDGKVHTVTEYADVGGLMTTFDE